jgi:hypothetical protein
LRENGFETHHFSRKDLGFGTIWRTGDDLCDKICALEPNYDDRVFLVGHSMGGLVARAANRFALGLVDGIVTICTPHYGVSGAQRAFFSTSAREMCLDSDLLNNLNNWEPQKNIMSVYGERDRVVSKKSAVWKRSNRVLKSPGGHVTPLYDVQVARNVVSYFDSIRSESLLAS